MKNLKFLLIISALVLIAASCDNFMGNDSFLDQKPKDFVSPDNFSTESDIRNALNGTYRSLVTESLLPVGLDFMTDNGFMDKTWAGFVEFWDQTQTPNSLYAEKVWNRDYAGILRANTVLKYIDEVEMDSTAREEYRGEALFLRAYFYSSLIQFYGDVPLRTEPEGIDQKDAPREDKEVILDQIMEDLDAAAARLPVEYEDASGQGKATQGAALAFKARILLYNEKWQQAADAAKQVMDMNRYELFPDYAGLFKMQNEYNSEVIFDVQFIQDHRSDGLTSSWYTYFFQWSSYMGLVNLEREYYMQNGMPVSDPSSGYDPQNPWENRDPRLGYTMVLPYTENCTEKDGSINTYIPYSKKSANFSSLRIRKWVTCGDDYVAINSGLNVILMRYADILLMRAEALVEQSDWAQHRQEIVDLVNQVRQRPTVEMPTITEAEGTGLAQDELRQIIHHERRVEFAFEGTRIYDIARWDIGEEAYTDALGYDPAKLRPKDWSNPTEYDQYSFRERSFNSQKGYLWPIPSDEINSNDLITTNNPGY